MTSQRHRGGGSIGIEEASLWNALHKSISGNEAEGSEPQTNSTEQTQPVENAPPTAEAVIPPSVPSKTASEIQTTGQPQSDSGHTENSEIPNPTNPVVEAEPRQASVADKVSEQALKTQNHATQSVKSMPVQQDKIATAQTSPQAESWPQNITIPGAYPNLGAEDQNWHAADTAPTGNAGQETDPQHSASQADPTETQPEEHK